MLVGDLILAVILGLFFTAIYAAVARTRAGTLSAAFVFLVFFLFAWAGGLWIRPFGPPVLGVYWLPGFILMVLLFLLLISLAWAEPHTPREAGEEKAAREATAAAIGLTFWILIGALLAAVIIGYLL